MSNCKVRYMLIVALRASQSPERSRPLPSDSLEHCLSCLFATSQAILRGCYLLRLAKPSIGCHGARRNEEELVFVRIFNAFMLFKVRDPAFIALVFFEDCCFDVNT